MTTPPQHLYADRAVLTDIPIDGIPDEIDIEDSSDLTSTPDIDLANLEIQDLNFPEVWSSMIVFLEK